MSKKKFTKIDPKEKLSPYLNYQSSKHKYLKRRSKMSASLQKLRLERKNSLIHRLGAVILASLIIIVCLGYYISPIANVNSIRISGASDLPLTAIAAESGVQAKDKVLSYLLHQDKMNHLTMKYNEIKSVNVNVERMNQLVLHINEYPTIGYIKIDRSYRKILAGGKIGSQPLAWSKVDATKPLFISYNHDVSLRKDIRFFNSLPANFRKQVKLINGKTKRKTQVIFTMKDGNVIIGDIYTLKGKLKYYDKIKAKAGKNSVIDLEVGNYSYPLSAKQKKVYNVS